jgi:nucleoside-diphosphate-sugar epimerase
VSVRELVRTLIDVSGVATEPEIRGEGAPPGEIRRQYLDSTAIREELGWKPRWELERGLRAAWEWYAALAL